MKECSISGRVRLLGTPAEESKGGKLKLIAAGAYEGVDACLMTHPMSARVLSAAKGQFAGVAYGTCIASAKFQAAFTGKPAHAALAPEEGINALDAAVLAYNGVSMLRQQTKPDERIHGIILEGGDRPNIVTANSLLDYGVRAPTVKETRALQGRVVKCFEGAAIATGCELEVKECVYYLFSLGK
jgi:amidohydrolase